MNINELMKSQETKSCQAEAQSQSSQSPRPIYLITYHPLLHCNLQGSKACRHAYIHACLYIYVYVCCYFKTHVHISLYIASKLNNFIFLIKISTSSTIIHHSSSFINLCLMKFPNSISRGLIVCGC